MEIRVWRLQNYRDCGYTCNPHKFEIRVLQFPCKVPVIPCKHLQCTTYLHRTDKKAKLIISQQVRYVTFFILICSISSYFGLIFIMPENGAEMVNRIFFLNTEKFQFFHDLFSILLSYSGLQEVFREESRIAYEIHISAGNGPFGQPGQY